MSDHTPGTSPPGAPASELAETLSAVRGGDVVIEGLHRLTGGASRETWAFTATSTGSGREELILRRDPPGRPGAPGSMALEADAMRAAQRARLPVPAVVMDDDGGRLGTAGLVMERVPGEALARRILRDDEYATARSVLAEQCGRFLAGLHAVDPGEVGGLEEPDQLAAYRESYEGVADVSPTFEATFRWLEAHRPPSQHGVVVHGDFRLGNIIVDAGGLRAAIDWELVHLGDPLEDLGWLCVKAWRFREPLAVGGFGTVDQLLEAYEGAGGAPVDRQFLHWWIVLNTLKWGVGCMSQAAAHLDGAVRSVELAAIGRRACEQEWDLLELLVPEATAAALAAPDAAHTPVADLGLHGRPTAGELLEAAREFLAAEVVPATGGVTQFHTRVAVNVVAMVERELALAEVHERRYRDGLGALGVDSTAALAAAIRDGTFDVRAIDLQTVLATSVRDKLTVANPKHLTL